MGSRASPATSRSSTTSNLRAASMALGEFQPIERDEWVPDAHVAPPDRHAPVEPDGDPVMRPPPA